MGLERAMTARGKIVAEKGATPIWLTPTIKGGRQARSAV